MKKIMALVMTMALTGAIFAGLSDVSLQGTAPRERACPHSRPSFMIFSLADNNMDAAMQELTAAAAETAEEAIEETIEETVPVEQANEVTEDGVEAAPVEEPVVEEATPIEDVVEEIAPVDGMDVAEGAPLTENLQLNVETFNTVYPPKPDNWAGFLGTSSGLESAEVLEQWRGVQERNHWVYCGSNYRALSDAEYDEVKAIRNKIVTVDPNFVINNAKYDKQGNWVSETRSPDNWK